MKYKVSAMALVVGALAPGSAFAACPTGQYEYVTDAESTPPTTTCVNVYSIGHNGKPAVTGQPTDATVHGARTGAEVHGTNGIALGSGAIVGGWTPPVPSSCTLSGGGSLSDWNGSADGCTGGGGSFSSGTPGTSTPVNNGTAIGAGASVQHDHSTALGSGANTTAPNQVMLGTAADTVEVPGSLHVAGPSVFDNAVTINTGGHTTTVDGSGATFSNATGSTNVDGGTVTTSRVTGLVDPVSSSDATNKRYVDGQNSAQDVHINATNDRLNSFNGTGGTVESWATGVDNWAGNVNGHLGSIDNTLASYGNQISTLQDWQSVAKGQISDLYKRSSKAYEGTAIALAAQNFTLETGKRFGVSANFGTFEGQSALASSMAIRLDTNWQLNGSVGFGTNNGTVGARAGVTGQW